MFKHETTFKEPADLILPSSDLILPKTVREQREAKKLAVASSHLPALVDKPSPPLVMFVGGGIMALTIAGLVAVTPFIAGLSADSTAANKVTAPTATLAVAAVHAVAEKKNANAPTTATGVPPTLTNGSQAVAALVATAEPVSPQQEAGLSHYIQNPDVPITAAQVTTGNNSPTPMPRATYFSDGTDTPTKTDMQQMQKQIDYQNEIMMEQHTIISLLASRVLDTQAGASSNAQLLNVPPDTPTLQAPVNESIGQTGDQSTSANVATNSAAPDQQSSYMPPAPTLDPVPWEGWRVFGMSANSVMLDDAHGDTRVVRRGDTFMGVRLIKVDAQNNTAYTSSGVVKGTKN